MLQIITLYLTVRSTRLFYEWQLQIVTDTCATNTSLPYLVTRKGTKY